MDKTMRNLGSLWIEDMTVDSQSIIRTSTIINLANTSNTSSVDIQDTTLTNWTTSPSADERSIAGLSTYVAVRMLSGVLAILGNSLTIYAVTKFERLQTCTNYLICSLAVSDIVAGLMVPLVLVHEFYPTSSFFIPVCLTQQGMALVAGGGNLISILYLSIDRYIYIGLPLRYQTLVTPLRVTIILTVSWIYSFISACALIVTANHLQAGMRCRYHIFLNLQVQLLFMWPQSLVIFVLTIGFHLAIAKIAHKQARQIQAQQQPYNTLDVAINQSTKKIGRTLGMVLGVYVGSLIPNILFGIVAPKAAESYDMFTVALYWCSSWVNPLIYAWRLKDFKIAFKKIFTGTGSFIDVPGMPAQPN